MLMIILLVVFLILLIVLSKFVLLKLPPVTLNIIKGVFIVIIIGLAYYNYDSIASKIELEKETRRRDLIVRDRLLDIKDAQISFKSVKGYYAKSFDQLTHYLLNDSLTVIKAEGEVPDSLGGDEVKAWQLGIIKRDTSLVPVRDNIFEGRFQEVIDSMAYIPFAKGKEFHIDAGEIERGKVKVKVFEVYATLEDIYTGLKTKNEGINIKDVIKVGSMEEPTTNGNWK